MLPFLGTTAEQEPGCVTSGANRGWLRGADLPMAECHGGLAFRFLQTADADLTITGSGDLVHKNSAVGNSVIFGSAGEKIGSQALVECIYTAEGTLKWIVSNLGGTTATVV